MEEVGEGTGLGRWMYWSGHLCLQKTEKSNSSLLRKKKKQNLETLPKPVIERLRAATESRDSVKSLCLRLFPSLSSAFFYVGFIFLLALFLL